MTAALRFALLGSGRIGQVHAANIAQASDTTLAWVADPMVEGARALADRYGARASESAEAVLDSGDLDAVLVAAPTPTHVPFIGAAVDRGIPVLCEKPIDLDLARVEELRPRVLAAGVPVALGFNRRFDPAFAEARARVEAGEVGELEQLTIVSRDPAPPPSAYVGVSGGLFRDMTIHDLDMARFFVGEIVEVSATGSALFDAGAGEHDDVDTAVTTLRAASGALVTIVNSRHSAAGYDQRLEAFGALGSVSVANVSTSLVSRTTASAVDQRAPYEPFFLERYAAAYRAELDEFVKLVRGEQSTSPTFDDGRAALILADAATRSARERTIVRL